MNYYALLEVDQKADETTIAANYRRLARLRHPDKNRDRPSATAEFQALQEAYSVLKDKPKRLEYDRTLYCGPAYAVPTDNTVHWKRSDRTDAFKFTRPFSGGSRHDFPGTYPPPPSPQKQRWKRKEDPELVNEIKEIRKELHDDERAINELKMVLCHDETLITVLWQLVRDVEEMIATAKQKKERLERPEIGDEWYTGLFDTGGTNATDTSVAVAAAPISQDVPAATAARIDKLARTEVVLQSKLQQIQEDLQDTVTKSRTTMPQIDALRAKKAEKNAKLTELCRRWRINEFGVDDGAGTNEDDAGVWFGWCEWDEKEERQWPGEAEEVWSGESYSPASGGKGDFAPEEKECSAELSDDQEPGGVPLSGGPSGPGDGYKDKATCRHSHKMKYDLDVKNDENYYCSDNYDHGCYYEPGGYDDKYYQAGKVAVSAEQPTGVTDQHGDPTTCGDGSRLFCKGKYASRAGGVWADDLDEDLIDLGENDGATKAVDQQRLTAPTMYGTADSAHGRTPLSSGWVRADGSHHDASWLEESVEELWKWREW